MESNRRDLGQWFTPPSVVDLTLALAHHACGREPSRIIDPTCGDGAFLRGVLRLGGSPTAIVGVELDPQTAAVARRNVPEATIAERDLFAFNDDEPFDLVVGNPPYVRLDRVSPAQRELAKRVLTAGLGAACADEISALCGRGDLAGPCLLRALLLVRPGGALAMVVSTALLDADYASQLWALIDRLGLVRTIVAAPSERWFADAAVNAMIVVIERRDSAVAVREDPVEIARLSCPTAEAAARGAAGVHSIASIRNGRRLDPKGWAQLLRADEGWLDFQASVADRLVPLGARARLWRGATTGANAFFYLKRESVGDLESEVCVPLLRAPRGRRGSAILVEAESTEWVALRGPTEPSKLASMPVFAARVAANAHLAARPSLASRTPWWAFSPQPAKLFLPKAYSSRFYALVADEAVVGDQRLYAVDPAGVSLSLMAATLNSVFTALAIESTGRASMGLGALELSVADAIALPILDPGSISVIDASAIVAAFEQWASRPVGSLSHERQCTFRRATDVAIAAAHGLGAHAVDKAWDALLRANRERIDRVGSVPSSSS